MKRRAFLQSVVTLPAGAALLDTSAAAATPAVADVVSQAPAPAQPSSDALTTIGPDAVAALSPRFLTAPQFATLRRLADLFIPAAPPNPGALLAQAPEFIDNYLAICAADRQRLYRDGLDNLDKQSRSRFKKAFAELSSTEADQIVKPLFTPRGPMMSVVELGAFINRVHQDVRTVTMNSPEWNAAQAAAGNPVTRLLYWRNVDPTVSRTRMAPWQTRSTKS